MNAPRKDKERAVVQEHIFLMEERHRYHLQTVGEREKWGTGTVPISHADAVQAVPPLLKDGVTRNVVLLGLFGTLLVAGITWVGYFSQMGAWEAGLAGVGLVVALGVLLSVYAYYQGLEKFFFGDIAEGVVVHSETIDSKHFTLTYEFTTPSDIRLRRTVTGEWAKTRFFSPPLSGTPVALYYIDDNRFWLL